MTSIFARKLRLRPSILVLFVLLTVPVFFTIIAVTYLSNDTIARSNAEELVERFRIDAVEDIRNVFDPIKSLVRSAAVVGDEQRDFYSDNRSLRYLLSILLHNERIVSVYAGMADGSFRQARRIDPTVEIQGKPPPDGVKYAYRWIEPPKATTPVDHYAFLDANEKELARSDQATSYDPRTRFWYRLTAREDSLVITDPDVFAALGLIGFTVAAPFHAGGKVVGIAAIDLTLDGLSEYLAERKISPGTLSYILDQQGRVIANSERAKTYTNENGQVELQHITSLGHELPATAFSPRPRQNETLFSFAHAGQRYVASLSTLPPQFGKRWQLFIVTPLRDFTSTLERNNNRLLIFGLIAIALQILVIYFLSTVISSPLEKLALKVARIQEFSSENLPPLESDQKLELGGHSRFLTIFFSDLEAFATLSEELPAQDLLLRVSAYLEIVTKIVNEEAGTIDKFIGDGVMAFWGAPALLDDHAWHACVAALRIQHGMNGLNDRWDEQ